MQVLIGMTKAKAVEELTRALREVEATGGGAIFSVSIHGERNLGVGEVELSLSNEDMEDRPEVAERVFVDFMD